ncbi:LysE family translocator [Streptomyces sp. MUM 203J]|uniref:LysE family translocator n=1 Tax=Streptomyces sp. MUM 203J TaxID=2791990 RepID=UPI001F04B097|nr:LysE family translocator [Streptomyces sp. MUM 203J]MCH0539318.1 LysE family translocator [Streptomyces sp. MUM 203J]
MTISLAVVGSYTAVALLGAMSPGPDFALVSRFAALRGRRVGLGASAGVAAGMAVNTAAAVLGVGAVVAASPTVFRAVSIVGACYLIYLGVRSLMAAREPGPAAPDTAAPDPETPVPAAESTVTAFRQGLITNVLNPKSVVFLVALLPQFLTDSSTWLDKSVLGAITVLAVLLWFSLVALAVGAFQSVFRRPGARKALNAVMGLVLIALGASLFFLG